MSDSTSPMDADLQFFDALLRASVDDLRALLTDDFVLIDVMSGSVIERAMLLEVIGAGQLRFDVIEPADTRVRLYGSTAIVTGRTQMQGSFGGTPFGARSRYTHVYVQQEGRWRMATAQGTQIAPEQPQKA